MPLDEPAWWYGDDPRGIATWLAPIASIYGWAAASRYSWATPYRSRLPVICVGNFTAGGTGKTPLAMYLCEQLLRAGHRPVVLTRGYGGRLAGPHRVGGTDKAGDVGDEALLLARVAPTLVARDRRAGAHSIEADPENATVIVMDDGLQNRSWPRTWPSPSSKVRAASETAASSRRDRFVPHSRSNCPLRMLSSSMRLLPTPAIASPTICATISTDPCCGRPPSWRVTAIGWRASGSSLGPASAPPRDSLPC